MTLESYRNFVAIVDCGSIMAAANRLLIAQPSLSNQLKNIERTYGAQLLIRNSRSVELTEAGRIFYNKAKEICRIEENMRESIASQQTSYRRQLKISIPAGNSVHYIQNLFYDFAVKYPDINYDLYEIPSDFVIPNVLNGVTEIGLIRSSIPHYNNLSVLPYEKEEIVAVIPREHALAQKKEPLQIADFAGCPLSVPFDILTIVCAVFGQHAVAPNISIITSINGTAIEWARSFGSIALIPYSKEDTEQTKNMMIRRIDNEAMYVTSVFLIHKERRLSETAELFLKEIKKHFSNKKNLI